MINFDYLNLDILVASTIFFYCLFNGYFSSHKINKFLHSHPRVGTVLILFGCVLLILAGVLYLTSDTAYAMAPESSSPAGGSDLPKGDVKVTTGDVSNSVTIKDSTINIPDMVARGLSNLGTGAAVAAGITGGSSIAAKSGGSLTAKLGIMAAGGLIGGASLVIANATNIITQNKFSNDTPASAVKSSTLSTTSTSAQASSSPSQPTTPTSNTGGGSFGDGGVAFSIEPGADLDTVMSLLDANHILHLCILYLAIALIILYVSTMIVENKWNLIFIKNILGDWFYNLLIKSLSYTGKYNRIWMFIGWVFLVFASLVALYVSDYLINNIDIISEIVQQSKR